jgi:hypothetical protein
MGVVGLLGILWINFNQERVNLRDMDDVPSHQAQGYWAEQGG